MFEDDSAGMVEVYRTSEEQQAEMVQGLLEQSGIVCVRHRALLEGADAESWDATEPDELHVIMVQEADAEEASILVPEPPSSEDEEARKRGRQNAMELLVTLIIPLLIGLLAVALIVLARS